MLTGDWASEWSCAVFISCVSSITERNIVRVPDLCYTRLGFVSLLPAVYLMPLLMLARLSCAVAVSGWLIAHLRPEPCNPGGNWSQISILLHFTGTVFFVKFIFSLIDYLLINSSYGQCLSCYYTSLIKARLLVKATRHLFTKTKTERRLKIRFHCHF